MPKPVSPDQQKGGRPFLGVQFVSCRTYGRLYLNAEKTVYSGRCPRCGAMVHARVGEHGTDQRFFLAMCGR